MIQVVENSLFALFINVVHFIPAGRQRKVCVRDKVVQQDIVWINGRTTETDVRLCPSPSSLKLPFSNFGLASYTLNMLSLKVN